MIDLPKAWEGVSVLSVNQPIYTKPDSCGCARISELQTEYGNSGSTYSSFSHFLQVKYQTTIAQDDLNTLLALCSGTNTCKYIDKPIMLPPVLQCGAKTCVDCATVKGLYDEYKVKFPDALPAYLLQEDDLQEKKNNLFEHFMNTRLGFSKTYHEYLSFMDSCQIDLNGGSPRCDSLALIYQTFQTQYQQAQSDIQNGRVSNGYRITDGATAVIQAANAIVKAREGLALSDGYGLAPYNNNFTALLKSVIPLNSSYQAILPLPLPYTFTYPELENNTVLSSDFITGSASPAELQKKYHALSLSDRGIYFQCTWSTQNSTAYAYYGLSTPLNKYLPQQTSNVNDVFSFQLFSVLPTVTTAQQFDQFYTNIPNNNPYNSGQSPYLIPISEIRGIRNLRLDFLPSPNAAFIGNARCLKLTLDKVDGSQQDAYLWTPPNYDGHIRFKEAVVDTNLYNPDCQAAFANYFNNQFQSAYSYQQLQQLYQNSCNINLQACPTCDTSWAVYNPGADLAINSDLYTNATNNIAPANPFFDGEYFNAPTATQAGHYILTNKSRTIATASDTAVTMQWRVRAEAGAYINPFVQSGSQTWIGAEWTRDPADTSWLIATTRITGSSTLSGVGLSSNAHSLQTDWVRITGSNGSVLYFDDFKNICLTDSSNGGAISPMLCNNPIEIAAITIVPDGPCADSAFLATIIATDRYRAYKDSLNNVFSDLYTQRCLAVASLESFTVTHPVQEYHYTLYYYDQAGNLVKTIPPEGVDETIYNETGYFDAVKAARQAGTWKAPSHGLATIYRYNSLNQVVNQQSPDGGKSEFWYDRLGRLAISQNAKQAGGGHYSYTLYDFIGRPAEVGQKLQATAMTQTISKNQAQLNSWLNNGIGFDQVTRTVYDKIATLPVISGSTAATFNQKAYTMRNRVSHTLFYSLLNVNTAGVPLYDEYTTGNYYSYDIHGNVATLLNDYRVGLMQQHGVNRFKLMAYKYDLISGKVNEVHYQPGERDELYHRYDHDAENRITDVYTTFKKDFIGQRNLEDHEAFYSYYKHGPLAKTIIGQQQVQGIDYAYTLQGWLKAVNAGGALDATIIARDAYNFSLHYYSGDYAAINSNTPPLVNASGNVEFKPLYNGNIGAMAVNIKKLNQPLVYNYGYDQLNRLVSMDAFNGWDGASIFAPEITNDYKERISYDGNGNIISYQRNGSSLNGNPLQMDDMQYGYNKVNGRLANNRLRHVKDAIGNANYVEDIDNQPDDNYNYDAIGNLISDVKEGITNITWTVYGKIENITKANGTTIAYTYDAAGNRISKTVANSPSGDGGTTWYVRDATGNATGLYTTTGNTLNLSEQHLYGSSRLGIWNRNTNMDAVLPTPNIGIGIDAINATLLERGNKVFELSNQTGNILTTVSDKKVGVDNVGSDGIVDYYEADVVSAQDYYPFGFEMPGRQYGTQGKYGFNGKELDKETGWQDYGVRIYDRRGGRFLSVDPLTRSYPMLTPYSFAENQPIWAIDIDGLEKFIVTNKYSNGDLREVRLQTTYDKEAKAYVDMQFKYANGNRVTTKDVMVINKYYRNGKLEKDKFSFADNLTKDQNKLLNSTSKVSLKSGQETAYTIDDHPEIQEASFISDGLAEVNAIKRIPLIQNRDLNQSLNAGSFYYLNPTGMGQILSRSEVAGLGNSDDLKLYNLPSTIKEDGGIKSIDITINIAFSNQVSDKEFEGLNRGLDKVGSQIKDMYLKSGVKNVNVNINTQRSANFGEINRNSPDVQISLKR